jgi:hypothetical protein
MDVEGGVVVMCITIAYDGRRFNGKEIPPEARLFNLIGLTTANNPRLRETVRGFQDQTAKTMMDFATANPERWAAHVKRLQEDGTSPPGPVSDDKT